VAQQHSTRPASIARAEVLGQQQDHEHEAGHCARQISGLLGLDTQPMKRVFGGLMIVGGVIILLWVAYNLLIERQREFKDNPLTGIVFSIFLIACGTALVRDKKAA
jgi:hypothetical protein